MKTRPTPETDAHKRHMDHESFLSELAETYTLARKLERERDEAREQAAIVPELVTTLEACSLVLAGERLSKTFLVNALEKAQSALTKAKGQP